MSHFTVLVVGADHEAALQPFHEFECTGTNDQYVQELDETTDKREEYEADTQSVVIDPSGVSHFLFTDKGDYDVRFCQPGPHGRKEKFIPSGWAEGECPTKDRFTLREWLESDGTPLLDHKVGAGEMHMYHYYTVDANGEVDKIVRRTNPNKRWDWWTVGGRWPDRLLFKDGTRGDRGRIGDIDLDGMLAEKAKAAGDLWDKTTSVIAGREIHGWASVRRRRDAGEFDLGGARDFFNDQLVWKELVEAEVFDRWDGAEELDTILAAKDRASYVERQAQVTSSFWALLHEGHWSERGEMGWFGMSDATPGSEIDYAGNFWLTLRSLGPDEIVTVVDCHI